MSRFIVKWGVVFVLTFFIGIGLAQEDAKEDIENLTMNGGGEIDSNSDGIPDGWSLATPQGSNASVQMVEEPKTEGKFSVTLNLDEKYYCTLGLPQAFLDMPLMEDTVLHLKVDIRFDKPEGGYPGSAIRWQHGGKKLNEFQTYDETYRLQGAYLCKSLKPNIGFKTYEMINKVPAGRGIPQLDITSAAGAGTIYIDNIRVFIEHGESF